MAPATKPLSEVLSLCSTAEEWQLQKSRRFGLRPQGPCRVGTGESGLVFSGGMELCLPLELFMG